MSGYDWGWAIVCVLSLGAIVSADNQRALFVWRVIVVVLLQLGVGLALQILETLREAP